MSTANSEDGQFIRDAEVKINVVFTFETFRTLKFLLLCPFHLLFHYLFYTVIELSLTGVTEIQMNSAKAHIVDNMSVFLFVSCFFICSPS